MLLRASEVEKKEVEEFESGISWFDKYMKGGLKTKSLYLFTGGPNAGKTTLALQIANEITCSGRDTLFVQAEMEGDKFLEIYKKRLGLHPNIVYSFPKLGAEARNDISEWVESLDRPGLLVIDSLQEIRDGATQDGCLSYIKKLTEEYNLTTIVICQLTHAGHAKGGTRISYLADVHLAMEDTSELNQKSQNRAIWLEKNRYGTCDRAKHLILANSGFKSKT